VSRQHAVKRSNRQRPNGISPSEHARPSVSMVERDRGPGADPRQNTANACRAPSMVLQHGVPILPIGALAGSVPLAEPESRSFRISGTFAGSSQACVRTLRRSSSSFSYSYTGPSEGSGQLGSFRQNEMATTRKYIVLFAWGHNSPSAPHMAEVSIRIKLADREPAPRQSASFVPMNRC